MFADYHVHTEFSDDSEYPMEQVIKDAVSMGMDELCFTDHVDYGVKVDWDDTNGYEEAEMTMNVDYPLYAARIKKLQYLYDTRLKIKMGLELVCRPIPSRPFRGCLQNTPLILLFYPCIRLRTGNSGTRNFNGERARKNTMNGIIKNCCTL